MPAHAEAASGSLGATSTDQRPRMGPVHGLARFQTGCRCSACSTAEQARVRQIGRDEEKRWRELNQRADQRWQQWRLAAQENATARQRRAGTRWTPQQLGIALDRSLSVEQAASMLGRSNSAIATIRTRYRRASFNSRPRN